MELTKILIVDDDPVIRHALSKVLQHNYDVAAAACGQCAIRQIEAEQFALGLLDIHLGDMNGIDLLKIMKTKSPDTVFIMLTGQGSLETAVAALRHGAHDYIQKPFKPTQLIASLQRGLEKRQELLQNQHLLKQIQVVRDTLEQIDLGTPLTVAPEPQQPERFIEQGSLQIDLLRHRVLVNNRQIQLSPIEYKLLVFLAEAAPRVVSPQELVTAVQGHDSESWEASEIIRPHIYRIRQKMRVAAPKTAIIQTIRGIGYSLCE